MRALPPQTLHDPIEAGPYRMTMGLTAVADSAWFEFDALYPAEMAEKRALLQDRRLEVFAAMPESQAARAETLNIVAANLCTHHADWFVQDGPRLRNRLTAETWNLTSPSLDPIELAARLVQEDLCLIQDSPIGPMFTAGVVCFPSRWLLDDKIGKPLAAVHGPVPLFANRLAGPVDRFMHHLKPGHIAGRLNWSVLDDPALFQPAGKWRQAHNARVTADNAGDALFARVERQTLRRLPHSGAVLFGIRVHVYPLARLVTGPRDAERIASAVRALPEEIAQYKSLPPFRSALLAWLDGRAG